MLDPTTGVLTGYIYDAEGQRVEKVLVNGWNTPTPTTTVENEYLLGPNGEQVTVLGVNAAWQWTNVYAGARQLATYDSAGTHFTLTDWLGTKRMQLGVTAASTVTVGEQCTSLPYGDGLNCTGSDVNHLYFTGKERDTESGNDYFLARYYSSNMGGRFLTPDWSKNPQGVPYANYSNPQSLNLYAYVADNPQSLADADGHCTDTTNAPCKLAQAAKKNSAAAQSKSQQQGGCDAVSHPCTTVTVHGNSMGGSILPALSQAWSYVKSHPLTGTFIYPLFGGYIGPAVNITYLPKTKNLCVAPGLGGADGRNISVGLDMVGNLANAKNITKGGSISVGAQATPFLGAQATGNFSGIMGGLTVGNPGGSVTATYGFCF